MQGRTMSQITVVEKPVFLKKKHELQKLLNSLERATPQAVDLIVETMNSDNEIITTKMKLECAKSLLELQIKVSTEISRDQLTRQIAEIKVNGLSRPLEGNEPKKLPPKRDFTTIQEVE